MGVRDNTYDEKKPKIGLDDLIVDFGLPPVYQTIGSARMEGPLPSAREQARLDAEAIIALAEPPSPELTAELAAAQPPHVPSLEREIADLHAIAARDQFDPCPRSILLSFVHPIKGVYRAGRVRCSCWHCTACNPKLKAAWIEKYAFACSNLPVTSKESGRRRRINWKPTTPTTVLYIAHEVPESKWEELKKQIQRAHLPKKVKGKPAISSPMPIGITGIHGRIRSPGWSAEDTDSQTFLLVSTAKFKGSLPITPAAAFIACRDAILSLPSPCSIPRPVMLSHLWLNQREPEGWMRVGAFPSRLYDGSQVGAAEVIDAIAADDLTPDVRVPKHNTEFMDLTVNTHLPGFERGMLRDEVLTLGLSFHRRLLWRIKGYNPDEMEAMYKEFGYTPGRNGKPGTFPDIDPPASKQQIADEGLELPLAV